MQENKCCGCGACIQVCPQQCINFIENERGFLVPSINHDKCINCGCCKKICPEITNKLEYKKVENAYAVVSKNFEELKKSTSGGMFAILAEKIIQKNGVVFGAAWEKIDKLSHVKIDKIEDLYKIMKSKYVQSNTKNTFKEAKELLDRNIAVLYSGTACQIAGLKMYLNKEYLNLYTVEVACHGVPSIGLFKKYIEWREKQFNSKVKDCIFRNKDKHQGGEHYKLKMSFENGKTKYFHFQKDPYYNAFINGVSIRKTCYDCKYKKERRIADFTLCDFWGIEKVKKDFPANHGVSAVLLNSNKAKELFNEINEKIYYEEVSKDSIYSHNKSLIMSCDKKNCERFNTLNIDSDLLFEKIKIKISLVSKLKIIIKGFIPEKMLYYLRRVWGK